MSDAPYSVDQQRLRSSTSQPLALAVSTDARACQRGFHHGLNLGPRARLMAMRSSDRPGRGRETHPPTFSLTTGRARSPRHSFEPRSENGTSVRRATDNVRAEHDDGPIAISAHYFRSSRTTIPVPPRLAAACFRRFSTCSRDPFRASLGESVWRPSFAVTLARTGPDPIRWTG